jgi:hypothetical protein
MTEAEWFTSTDSPAMLSILQGSGRASERKLRLFAAACCRRIWHLFQHERSRTAVEKVEQFADDAIGYGQMTTAACALWAAIEAAPDPHLADADSAAGAAASYSDAHQGYVAATSASGNAARAAASDDNWETEMAIERAAQAVLLRDIFGPLPFRPPSPLLPSLRAWQGGLIVQMAHAIYEERSLPEGTLDIARLAVLADALEEAGADTVLLDHLRGPGPHVRGCWLVDLLTGRT